MLRRQVQSSHSLANAVLRAAAWSDGGAEFIFGDGAILSFVDGMNTFVAVRNSSHSWSSVDRTSCLRPPRQPVHAKGTSTTAYSGDADGEGCDREMCFTAWTLSAYEEKVRAALDVYNSLTERPRLISTLLSDIGSHPFTLCAASSSLPSGEPFHDSCYHRFVRTTSAHGSRGRCAVWREPGPPLHTLLLEKRADLFTRHVVYGSVQEWLVAPAAAATSTAVHNTPNEHAASSHNSTTFSVHEVVSRVPVMATAEPDTERHRVAAATGHLRDASQQVPVGTVLELWCALRRVRLTVAAHRETFTVLWPAPVTKPDGSRLPPSSTTTIALSPLSSSSVSGAVLFTYVEQTFPVCSPPESWRVMLQLALELDAELPPSARSAGNSEAAIDGDAWTHHETNRHAADCGAVEEEAAAGWLGALPDPQHWGGELNQHRTTHPCRFSALTVEQAAHLAAPRTTRALEAMRVLHTTAELPHSVPPGSLSGSTGGVAPAAARLCWMYEANRGASSGPCGDAGGSPPAVYWCVPSAQEDNTAVVPPSTLPREMGGADATDVLAWVAEDGSVLRAHLESGGYTIFHQRLTPSVSKASVYRLKADGAALPNQRLPPRIAALRCRIEQSFDGGFDVRTSRDDVLASTVSAVAVVDPLQLFCEARGDLAPEQLHGNTPDGVACVEAEVCRTLSRLTALTPAWSDPGVCAQARAAYYIAGYCGADERCLRAGRYLASVADVAVQLSQLNCAVSRACFNAELRAAQTLRPSSASLAAYCRPKVLQERSINAPYTTSAFSSFSPTSSAAAAKRGSTAKAAGGERTASLCVDPAAMVYLTTYLDGIGTFTALTNGTMRAHFDDRTLVTLIPGINELDESQLLLTGVLRSAQRCTVHAAQCRPGHPLFRYLAYLLPFRRYVYLQAANAYSDTCAEQIQMPKPSTTTESTLSKDDALHRDIYRTDAITREVDDRWKGSHVCDGRVFPVGSPYGEDSLCQLPSALTSGVASSSSSPSFCGPPDNVPPTTQRSSGENYVTSTFDELEVCRGSLRSPPARDLVPAGESALLPRWGITDSRNAPQQQRERETAELARCQERLAAMLAENEALSQTNRALLRS